MDYYVLLLLLLLLSLSPLYRIFTRMSPRQTMSLGDTMLQPLFRFIASTVYGAYLPRSYVIIIIIIIIILLYACLLLSFFISCLYRYV